MIFDNLWSSSGSTSSPQGNFLTNFSLVLVQFGFGLDQSTHSLGSGPVSITHSLDRAVPGARARARSRVRASARLRSVTGAQSDQRIFSIIIQINNSSIIIIIIIAPCVRARASRQRAVRHFSPLFLNVVALEEWWWILSERADHGQCRRIMSYVSSQGKSYNRSSDRLRWSLINAGSRWPADDWQLSLCSPAMPLHYIHMIDNPPSAWESNHCDR